MREALRDYLSIFLSGSAIGIILFGWASGALDDRINTAVAKAMAPFVAQLKTNTQTLQKHDTRLQSLEDQVASVDEVEF